MLNQNLFNFDPNFELQNNVVVPKRGDACIYLQDCNGYICKCILENGLYIPTFKQNICSVQMATKNSRHKF